ncbi:PIG-L family deacetylase [Candidatus Woesearchaeota archaeon]|nr:PIG-L family deacetylase [Candidatus Woesearchaeota archaeon]
MAETILFLCAHNDDQIIGGGGTFAKYANEGKRVKTVVFSYGQQSHPYLKPGAIVKTRVKEALKSDRILGGSGITFLGLAEGKFLKGFAEKGIKDKVTDVIDKEKPDKIFTHSIDDPHPDHKAVHKLVTEITTEKRLTNIYTFDVWNPLNIRRRDQPRLVVDVTKTFQAKLKAYDAHESQVYLPLMIPMRLRMIVYALLAGWNNQCRYAEVFRKLA